MREYLDSGDLSSKVMMLRQTDSRTFLVVEGPSDYKLMSTLVDPDRCVCIDGYGRPSVLEAMAAMENMGVDGVVAIIDADFDRIAGDLPASDSVLVSEFHDLEIGLLVSPAFDRFLLNWGSREKIKAFMSAADENSVVDTLLASAAPIGALRLHSEIAGLGLKFSGLKYKNRVNKTTLVVDVSGLVAAVLETSNRRRDIAQADAEAAVRDILGFGHDLRQLCQGHDVMQIVAIGLKSALGSLSEAEGANPQSVETALRTAYWPEDFAESSLYTAIREWEMCHAPWLVVNFQGSADGGTPGTG